MAINFRIKSADLIQQLNQDIKRCDLFYLLHCFEKDYAYSDFQCNEVGKLPIILKSTPELSFPIADIKAVRYNNKDQLEIYINFMGLYGVDSPLPQYWNEEILNDNSTSLLCDFANIFQHRIYILLYLTWKKYQPIFYGESHNLDYFYYLVSLSGGLLHFESYDKEYAYAGLLGQRIHNAETLKGIISNYLDGMPVAIKQLIPEWLEINATASLLSNNQNGLKLNENALLGNKILDVSTTVVITLGPTLFTTAVTLLTDQDAKKRLFHIIKLYTGVPYHIKIAMKIIISQSSFMKLGNDTIYLTWNSCLGKLNFKQAMICLGKITS